ncbi:hypothetical protein DdX_21349 [Ditylenchus destructor]|uniref:Uncharacterized protein n=1 Tax=Ditylenchus destructor TaxID=166010 RepID=A0AAD4MJ86_9BILA|nr:hypothetical protein DdX_21349 [Ditylenchus destructor]
MNNEINILEYFRLTENHTFDMTNFNTNETMESAPLAVDPEFQMDNFPLLNASVPSNAREKRSERKQMEKCNVVCRRMCLRICPHVRAGERKRASGDGNCELGCMERCNSKCRE